MDYKEFFNLVKDMRRAQKNYFAHRSHDDLQKAKSLEKQVDKIADRPFGEQNLFEIED